MPDSTLKSHPPAKASPQPRGPRRWWRIPAVLLGGLLLLPGLCYVLLDPLVKYEIRGFLEDSLKVPARLRTVRVFLAGGARLEGLTVLNPEGYREPEAFHLATLEAVTRATFLLSNPRLITELTLRQPEFIVEFGDKETNWATLIRNAARQLSRKDPHEDSEGIRYAIHNIHVIEPRIRVAPTKLFPDGLLIPLRDVDLDQVGNLPDSPSTFYVAVAIILQAVITGKTRDGSEIPSALRSRISAELQEGGKAFREALSPRKK